VGRTDRRPAISSGKRPVPGPLVDEIDVEPLDFGDELIKSVDHHKCFAYGVPPPGRNVPVVTT
jgi:hypothetical protein